MCSPSIIFELFTSQFHSCSSLFLFFLLNTIIFVFSTFISCFFFLTYFTRLFVISFISLSLFATITKSFANARLQTISLPTTLPLAQAFRNISSISATYIVNSKGLSGQPCFTLFVVPNHSPCFSPIRYLLYLFVENRLKLRPLFPEIAWRNPIFLIIALYPIPLFLYHYFFIKSWCYLNSTLQ
jgi:hypothetical protein